MGTPEAATAPAPAPITPGAPVPPVTATLPPSPPAQPAPPGRLTLIGIGHVFKVDTTIRQAILALHPDVVFVELDPARLQALVHRRRTGEDPTGGGFIMKRVQRFQKGLANSYGTEPGAEMLAACDGARMVRAKLLLVDPPLEETRDRLKKAMRIRDWLQVAGLVTGGAAKALWPFKRKTQAQTIEQEILRYQSDPDAMLQELAKRLPAVHRVVIEERNAVMAKRIREGLRGMRHGVAVVGDGHVPGMLTLLADLQLETYRLADVRAGRLPKPFTATAAPGETGKVTFTLMVDAAPPLGPPAPAATTGPSVDRPVP